MFHRASIHSGNSILCDKSIHFKQFWFICCFQNALSSWITSSCQDFFKSLPLSLDKTLTSKAWLWIQFDASSWIKIHNVKCRPTRALLGRASQHQRYLFYQCNATYINMNKSWRDNIVNNQNRTTSLKFLFCNI